ncbi:MAG TPA: lysylphosphatidylglycerol synthase transmembrane domain-containing protein [Bryobacteraceae bacterium]|nr:lysylphosphatidylglycerol synthase transmembrane domain-containing protein [Bryobacteraceae bacterium]
MALLYRAEALEAARYHGCLAAPQSQKTRWIALVLINLASLALLVWALRDVTFGDLKEDLATIDYAWVVFAVAIEVGVYLFQAVRWRLVFRPVVSLSFRRTARAIFVGLFCSEVMPFRGGEAVRCFLVTRWTKLPFSVSMASVLIERVFDGLWLWLGLWLSLRYVELPKQLGYVNDGLGLFVLGGAVVLGLALFRPRPPRAKLRVPGWRHHLVVLMDDLALIGHSRYLYFALLQSLPYLLLQVIPIWAAFRAYGFDLGIGAAFALMLILRLSSIVPQAPVNLGLFQILTKQFLERAYDVDSSEAARFSLVLWGVVKFVPLIAGFIALAITGAKISELKKAAEAAGQADGEVAPMSSS